MKAETLQDVSQESLLAEVVDEFTERLGRGEQPRIEDYAERHPELADTLRQVLPALQAMGSKYGARQCEGLVDFGLVFCDVENGAITRWQPLIVTIAAQRAEAIKI